MSSTGERVWFVWLTTLDQDLDHAVTDEEMAAGGLQRRGVYRGLCGAVFLPAPMERAPGVPCPYCVAVVLPDTSKPDRPRRRTMRVRVRRWITTTGVSR